MLFVKDDEIQVWRVLVIGMVDTQVVNYRSSSYGVQRLVY